MAEQEGINLTNLVKSQHKYELAASYEPPEDAAARRAKDVADAHESRTIRMILLVFSLAVITVIVVGCIYGFVVGSADDKKWAAGIISAIASGLVGYLVGQGKRS